MIRRTARRASRRHGSAARDRHHGGELRVASAASVQRSPRRRRTGRAPAGVLIRCQAGQDEDARTDDGAHAERGEADGPQHATQPMIALDVRQEDVHRLGHEQLLAQRHRHFPPSGPRPMRGTRCGARSATSAAGRVPARDRRRSDGDVRARRSPPNDTRPGACVSRLPAGRSHAAAVGAHDRKNLDRRRGEKIASAPSRIQEMRSSRTTNPARRRGAARGRASRHRAPYRPPAG
jgi:hypothetical protein